MGFEADPNAAMNGGRSEGGGLRMRSEATGEKKSLSLRHF